MRMSLRFDYARFGSRFHKPDSTVPVVTKLTKVRTVPRVLSVGIVRL
jgi:hypothetical protein